MLDLLHFYFIECFIKKGIHTPTKARDKLWKMNAATVPLGYEPCSGAEKLAYCPCFGLEQGQGTISDLDSQEVDGR